MVGSFAMSRSCNAIAMKVFCVLRARESSRVVEASMGHKEKQKIRNRINKS